MNLFMFLILGLLGNMPHVLDRITAHEKCLDALVLTGICVAHRGNQAASIKLEKLYGMPVMFSGLASMVFSDITKLPCATY